VSTFLSQNNNKKLYFLLHELAFYEQASSYISWLKAFSVNLVNLVYKRDSNWPQQAQIKGKAAKAQRLARQQNCHEVCTYQCMVIKQAKSYSILNHKNP